MVHRRNSLTTPAGGTGGALSRQAWEQVESRIGSLARLERMWGRSGGGGSSSTLGTAGGGAGAGANEDRERRIFGDALKDGYVLCQ